MEARHASADFTDDGDDDVTEDERGEIDMDNDEDDEEEELEEEEDEDEDGQEDSPLLPIFSAAHLGAFATSCFPLNY